MGLFLNANINEKNFGLFKNFLLNNMSENLRKNSIIHDDKKYRLN